MEKRRKLDEDSLQDSQIGYVSNVTPIKQSQSSKARYFTADLQTSKEVVNRVVCFSPEKHQEFTKASESCHAFELKKTKVSPGREHLLDIKLFRDSEILQFARKLDFSKSYTKFIEVEKKDAPPTQLKDLKQYQLATVNVEVKSVGPSKTIHTKYGPRDMAQAIVADNTDALQLSIWGSQIVLKEAEFYKISNVLPKMYEDKMQVGTTGNTQVIPIAPIENAHAYQPPKMNETISFSSVQVSKTQTCSVCYKLLDIPDDSVQLIKCHSCNFKQRKSALLNKMTLIGYHDNESLNKKNNT